MRSVELELPVLAPPSGGLARLVDAMHRGPQSRRPWLAIAIGSAAVCALMLLAPHALQRQREQAFAQRIDTVLQQAARSVPLKAEGYVLSSDRRLDNGTRVFELRRQPSEPPRAALDPPRA